MPRLCLGNSPIYHDAEHLLSVKASSSILEAIARKWPILCTLLVVILIWTEKSFREAYEQFLEPSRNESGNIP